MKKIGTIKVADIYDFENATTKDMDLHISNEGKLGFMEGDSFHYLSQLEFFGYKIVSN